MAAAVCLVLIPTPLLLWMLMSPQSMWRATAAWAYRNPEANEPSEAGYAAHRVIAAIALIGLVVVACWFGRIAEG